MAQTYHARIGDEEYELVFEGDRLLLDGTPVDYVFTRLDERYFALQVDGRSTGVVVEPAEAGEDTTVTLHGRRIEVHVKDERDLLLERFGLEAGPAAGERALRAPMPGLVLDVLVDVGQAVEGGEGLLVLEAMKMENELKAPAAGTVAAIHAGPGDPVDKDTLLIELES